MTKEKEGAWTHNVRGIYVFIHGNYSRYQDEALWYKTKIHNGFLEELKIPVELC